MEVDFQEGKNEKISIRLKVSETSCADVRLDSPGGQREFRGKTFRKLVRQTAVNFREAKKGRTLDSVRRH